MDSLNNSKQNISSVSSIQTQKQASFQRRRNRINKHIFCQKCQVKGHLSKNCPKNNNPNGKDITVTNHNKINGFDKEIAKVVKSVETTTILPGNVTNKFDTNNDSKIKSISSNPPTSRRLILNPKPTNLPTTNGEKVNSMPNSPEMAPTPVDSPENDVKSNDKLSTEQEIQKIMANCQGVSGNLTRSAIEKINAPPKSSPKTPNIIRTTASLKMSDKKLKSCKNIVSLNLNKKKKSKLRKSPKTIISPTNDSTSTTVPDSEFLPTSPTSMAKLTSQILQNSSDEDDLIMDVEPVESDSKGKSEENLNKDMSKSDNLLEKLNLQNKVDENTSPEFKIFTEDTPASPPMLERTKAIKPKNPSINNIEKLFHNVKALQKSQNTESNCTTRSNSPMLVNINGNKKSKPETDKKEENSNSMPISKEFNLDLFKASSKRKLPDAKISDQKDRQSTIAPKRSRKTIESKLTQNSKYKDDSDNDSIILLDKNPKKSKRTKSTRPTTPSNLTEKLKEKSKRPTTPVVEAVPFEDYNCWMCHKGGNLLCCDGCCRVYHLNCLHLTTMPEGTYYCGECSKKEEAEKNQKSFVVRQFGKNRELLIECLMGIATRLRHDFKSFYFREPVDTVMNPSYLKFIVYPMDITKLENRIRHRQIKSPAALLSEVNWIHHNSIVFNGMNNIITAQAKKLVKLCETECYAAEVSPQEMRNVYLALEKWKKLPKSQQKRYIINEGQNTTGINQAAFSKPNTGWFTIVNDHNKEAEKQNVAQKIYKSVLPQCHPIVWAKYQNFPFWPGKLMSLKVDQQVPQAEIRFFGEHDWGKINVSQIFHASKEQPHPNRNKASIKKGLSDAVAEMEEYANNIKKKYGNFYWFEPRTPLDVESAFILDCIINGPNKILRTKSPSNDRSRSVTPTNEPKIATRSRNVSGKDANEKDIDIFNYDNENESDKDFNFTEKKRKIDNKVDIKNKPKPNRARPKPTLQQTLNRVKEAGIKPLTSEELDKNLEEKNKIFKEKKVEKLKDEKKKNVERKLNEENEMDVCIEKDKSKSELPKEKPKEKSRIRNHISESTVSSSTLESPSKTSSLLASPQIRSNHQSTQSSINQSLNLIKKKNKHHKKDRPRSQDNDKKSKPDPEKFSSTEFNFLEKSKHEFDREKRQKEEKKKKIDKILNKSVEGKVISKVVEKPKEKNSNVSLLSFDSPASDVTVLKNASEKHRDKPHKSKHRHRDEDYYIRKSKKSRREKLQVVISESSSESEDDTHFNLTKYQNMLMKSVKSCLRGMYTDCVGPAGLIIKNKRDEIFKENSSSNSNVHNFYNSIQPTNNSLQVAQSLKCEIGRLKWKEKIENGECEFNHELSMKEFRDSLESKSRKKTQELLLLQEQKFEQEKLQEINHVKQNNWCSQCGELATLNCCLNTSYCGKECQLEHWKSHHMGRCQRIQTLKQQDSDKTKSPSQPEIRKSPKPIPDKTITSQSTEDSKISSVPNHVSNMTKLNQQPIRPMSEHSKSSKNENLTGNKVVNEITKTVSRPNSACSSKVVSSVQENANLDANFLAAQRDQIAQHNLHMQFLTNPAMQKDLSSSKQPTIHPTPTDQNLSQFQLSQFKNLTNDPETLKILLAQQVQQEIQATQAANFHKKSVPQQSASSQPSQNAPRTNSNQTFSQAQMQLDLIQMQQEFMNSGSGSSHLNQQYLLKNFVNPGNK